MPASVVIPVLHYPDVPAAVDWLCGAFGFTERLRIGDHRAQLDVATEAGSVIVAQCPPGALPADIPTHSIMVRVPDVDEHHGRSLGAGAKILSAPASYPYGERQYVVADLGGHVWTFSQTLADVEPSTWGGLLVNGRPQRTD